MKKVITLQLENLEHSIFKKNVGGFYKDENRKIVNFRFEEKGLFLKKRLFLVDGVTIISSLGSAGEVMILGEVMPLVLRRVFLRGLKVSFSIEGEIKSIDDVKVTRPSLDGCSNVVFSYENNIIFHCLLKKTKFVECFSKVDLRKIESPNYEKREMLEIMIFFWCCSLSGQADAFSGVE